MIIRLGKMGKDEKTEASPGLLEVSLYFLPTPFSSQKT